jgi:microcin C transport system ATP-binding protein
MPKNLLEIRDLDIAFKKGDDHNLVARGVSLDIHEAETMALVGESGSGKTVTAMSILKLLPSPPVIYPKGKILFNGVNTMELSDAELRHIRGNRIGVIFQEPMSSLNPLHTIKKQLNEAILLHQPLSSDEASAISLKWLERVGLKNPEERLNAFPHQLSGGEQQRVMVAIALVNRPELLIADEPTTALDVTIQAQILDLIKELKQELGMSILFITHDLNIVRRIADRVAVMQNGEIVEEADADKLFNAPAHIYTQELINSEVKGEPVNADKNAPAILKVDNLRVWFPVQKGVLRRTKGYIKAADNVSFTLKKGHTLGIVGESGSGKTTSGLAVLRLNRGTGSVIFKDHLLHEYSGKSMRPVRKHMQIIFQNPFGSLSPRMSAAQIIGEGLSIHERLTAEEKEERIIRVMEEVGLDPETRHRYPNEFSGGQRQRISIARAIVLKPEFIVLDEPTSSLDRAVQRQVIELLKGLQRRYGLSYIFISHDLKIIKAICHDVLVMKDGMVVEYGPLLSVFNNPGHAYTRELLRAAFE